MTERPCPHLEAELPSMERGLDRHWLTYLGDIDVVSIRQYDYQPSVTNRQISDFMKKLRSYGLLEHEVLIMVERFVFNKTFAEISDDHGFVDPRMTHKIYKGALEKAKKGFEFNREGKN